jgi:hypothetical protein
MRSFVGSWVAGNGWMGEVEGRRPYSELTEGAWGAVGRDDVWRRAIATCDGIGYGQGGHQIDPKPRGRRESRREAEGRMEEGISEMVQWRGEGGVG